jgi:DNA-binding NarL/FixJ family response regulator
METVQADRRRTNDDGDVIRLTTIILIDERVLTRQCLLHSLELSDRHLRIIGMSRLGEAEQLRGYGRIDLAVVNVGGAVASEPTIAATLDRLQDALPEVPQIVIADREDAAAVTAAIKQGVRGYIPTTLDTRVVIEALRFVQAGGTFVPVSALITAAPLPTVAATGAEIQPPPLEMLGFTPRELQVLEHLRRGEPNKIIAHELAMQESTVKVHVRQIMKKLNATNRTQAAFLAQRLIEEAGETHRLSPAPHGGHLPREGNSVTNGKIEPDR